MPQSKPPRHPKKPGRHGADPRTATPMPAHAHLSDEAGVLLGGIALRGEEWAVVLGGRVIVATESAGLAIAMLRHTATVLAAGGREATVDLSTTLRERATAEGSEAGKSLEEYLDFLEAERAERARERDEGPGATH